MNVPRPRVHHVEPGFAQRLSKLLSAQSVKPKGTTHDVAWQTVERNTGVERGKTADEKAPGG